jgi:SAM-dependent methyltransferase
MTGPAARVRRPPRRLAQRVGGTHGREFEEQGKRLKRCLIHCLPVGYDLAGKRVLDFGCGVGRILGHFTAEAGSTEFWGCDIYGPGIRWLARNYPGFHVFCSGERPPLQLPGDSFDLVYAVSVFTHLVEDSWSPWLAELRRIVKPGGVALVTYHDRFAYEQNLRRAFPDDDIGMLVLDRQKPWDEGGPTVYHSNAWIEENWGRSFVIEALIEGGMAGFQTVALMRKAAGAEARQAVPRIIRPFPLIPWAEGFHGTLDYDRFPGVPWLVRHGFQAGREARVGGWFVSERGEIVTIRFFLDGAARRASETHREERPDVRATFPGLRRTLESGFRARLDLGDVAPGRHQLAVTATDSAGREYTVSAALFRDG